MDEAFNRWWNSDGLVEDNPFNRETPAFWAWEGWVAGVRSEREACAKVLDEMAAKDRLSNYYVVAALTIRERGAP